MLKRAVGLPRGVDSGGHILLVPARGVENRRFDIAGVVTEFLLGSRASRKSIQGSTRWSRSSPRRPVRPPTRPIGWSRPARNSARCMAFRQQPRSTPTTQATRPPSAMKLWMDCPLGSTGRKTLRRPSSPRRGSRDRAGPWIADPSDATAIASAARHEVEPAAAGQRR